MIQKYKYLINCLILGLCWSIFNMGYYTHIYAAQRFISSPVSLESKVILQTTPNFTLIALTLSRRADFIEQYIPAVGNRMGELRLSSPSWNFPKLRFLAINDRLVHAVYSQRENEGSSVQIRLRHPVSYEVRWIDNLYQLQITISPDVEKQVAQLKSIPTSSVSIIESRDTERLVKMEADHQNQGEKEEADKLEGYSEKGEKGESAIEVNTVSRSIIESRDTERLVKMEADHQNQGEKEEADKLEGYSEKGEKGESAIEVNAGKVFLDERGKVIKAKDSVEVKREETFIRADEVRVDRTTTEVEAKGNVSVHNPEWNLKAKEVRLNLSKETGEIREGDIFIEGDHISLSGDRLKKLSGQTYHIDRGSFTTCLCDSGPPPWKISADKMDLTKEGAGIVKGGTFYILDVPVFYLPYGYFPLRTKRQSGLLFPKVGSSSKEGFRFQQPFYWAISKSSDATINMNFESRARIGLLGEYRKVLNRNLSGQLNVSYFNEALRVGESDDVGNRTISDQEIPKNRWSISTTHRGHHGFGWQTYSDISVFSDDLFTRELSDRFNFATDRKRNVRTTRYGRSRFGIYKNWNDIHLQGNVNFFQDFVQEDEPTFHQVPLLSFWGRQALGHYPAEFHWRAEGVNYLRKEGSDGFRIDLRPGLLVPFILKPYLTGFIDAGVRETAYHLYQMENLSDRNISRELFELKGNIGTSIGRVYPWNGIYLAKVKHVIEPQVGYLFISRSGQQDIPIMDGTDRINRRNILRFSLMNRLWGRYLKVSSRMTQNLAGKSKSSLITGQAQELGYLNLDLGYDIDKERKGGDSLSDLDMKIRLNPIDYYSLGISTGVNPGSWHVSRAAVDIFISDSQFVNHRALDRDFRQPNHLSLSYRYIRRGVNSPLVENANLVLSTEGSTAVCPSSAGIFDPRCERLENKNVLGEFGIGSLFHLTDHFMLLYDSSYNSQDGRFTSNRGTIKYLSKCECWTLGFSINRTTNPDKTSFNFSFNLLGLGSTPGLSKSSAYPR